MGLLGKGTDVRAAGLRRPDEDWDGPVEGGGEKLRAEAGRGCGALRGIPISRVNTFATWPPSEQLPAHRPERTCHPTLGQRTGCPTPLKGGLQHGMSSLLFLLQGVG